MRPLILQNHSYEHGSVNGKLSGSFCSGNVNFDAQSNLIIEEHHCFRLFMMTPSHMTAIRHTFSINHSSMTKFTIFELVLIQQPEVNMQSYFFNKYSSGALSSHLGHFGLRLSRFRETIQIRKKNLFCS